MSTLSVVHPTLLDLAMVLGKDNKVNTIIEILRQKNEILEDMVVKEANELTGHVTTVRTGYPAPTWRKMYGGVQPAKSTNVQIRDGMGMLEAYAEVDKALADLNGNTAAFRLSEDAGHLEGMNQEMASTLFYGNEGSAPEEFTGFAPRFNSLSAENGQNIISGGGSSGTDMSSIWLIVWGENTVHGIYSQGGQAGFHMEDKGQVTIENVDGSGGRMEAYRTHYRWDLGLVVRDWRYVVRIANIDPSDLLKTGATGADLIDLMTQALEAVQDLTSGKPVFYMGRTPRSFLRRQIVNKTAASTLTMDNVAGRPVMMFDGVPVRRVDALTKAEAVIA